MTVHSSGNDSITEHFDSPAYELFEKIGEGGFGLVYRAKQVNTGQIVAIKFIALDADFDEAKKQRYIERFERETLLCSRLQHPNIVRLLDKGRSGDSLYAVFEYVEGLTLKETLIKSGSLLPIEAAEIMAQVLDGLAHAHEQGVIHRDIKPANIMLTKTGAKTHAKVLDFGIGTLVNEARQLDYKSITLTQETLGTPSYSAPEQLRGEPPTPKTDIYVWGLVFIECLTGQPTVSGSSLAAIFHQQLSQSNVPLPAALAGHHVAGLLRRVLHKKSHERAGNAAELYNEFVQLNFATLVGELGRAGRRQVSTDHTTLIQDNQDLVLGDDTQVLLDQTEIRNVSDYTDTHTLLTERKQITALCVVLNIKAMGEAVVDDEIADALYRDQKAQCIDIAVRYGAFHVGTLVDTLLFYFGYPTVSDNDSRLAGRTALEITSRLHQHNSLLKQCQGIEVLPQMGMHTGMVTNHTDTVPEGDTVNTAVGLARLAAVNQVLCSDASKMLLDTYLEFKPQKPHTMGISNHQLMLHSLAGERHVEAFGFLRSNKNNYDFTGREQELQALQQLIATNLEHRNDNAEVVTKSAHIFGEAGIGKSRLMFEFRHQAQGFTHYVAQCLPEHKHNALYPILNMIKYKYSLDQLAPEAAVQLLRDEIAKRKQLKEQDAMPILCSWLALPIPEDLPTTAYSPDIQKQILFDVLIALLVKRSMALTQQPRLILFEDMHWADPTSIEFIACLSADKQFRASQDIFISTSRKPLPESLDNSGFLPIELLKLDKQQTTQFVYNLFNHQRLSDELLDVVVSRTDGIPLFIEELVDMLKQKELVLHLNGITDFVSPDRINEVPSSLRESLQQKLDGLRYAKETAQLAAAIGREFDYELLVAASNHGESQVQNDLNELIEAEIIYRQRKVNGDSYIFKHALVRDAAYASSSDEKNIKYHSEIASGIAHSTTFSVAKKEIYCLHSSKAKLFLQAVTVGIDVLRFKCHINDYLDVHNFHSTMVYWNNQYDDITQHRTNLIKINGLYLTAVASKSGYGDQEIRRLCVENLYHAKKANVKKIRNNELLEIMFLSTWYLMVFHHMHCRRKVALKYSKISLSLSQEFADLNLNPIYTYIVLAKIMLLDGKVAKAKEYIDKSFALKESPKDQEYLKVLGDRSFGMSHHSMLYMISSLVNAFLLDEKVCFEHAEQAIKIGKQNEDYNAVIQSCCYAVFCCVIFSHRDLAAYKEKSQSFITTLTHYLDTKEGFDYVQPFYQIIKAWYDSDPERIWNWIEHKEFGQGIMISLWAVMYTDAVIQSDEVVDAQKLDYMIAKCKKVKEVFVLPKLALVMLKYSKKAQLDKDKLSEYHKHGNEHGNKWAKEVCRGE